MTKLLIQHGPSKGKKIEDSINNNNSSGVIFSLREEKIESINSYISQFDKLNKQNIFFDSQFYYSTYDIGIYKNLENNFEFPLNVCRRDMRTNSERVEKYLENYSNFMIDKVESILIPGLSIDSIDWKFDYTLDIYKKFRDKYHFQNYYMTMVISSKLFHSKNDVDEILLDLFDETSIYEENGFYLIINYDNNNDSNYENIDSETLSNILYFVYSLKKKKFKVIVGYSFINSLLFSMIDCDYVGSGWFNNLRKFSNSKFENLDNFGRRKKKYFSIPLMSYVSLETINELKPYYNVDDLKSKTICDELAFENADNVSFVDLEHQFWEALNCEINEINKVSSIEEKIDFLKNKLLQSLSITEEIYNSLDQYVELRNIIKTNTAHLKEWIFAIELFTKKASILNY